MEEIAALGCMGGNLCDSRPLGCRCGVLPCDDPRWAAQRSHAAVSPDNHDGHLLVVDSNCPIIRGSVGKEEDEPIGSGQGFKRHGLNCSSFQPYRIRNLPPVGNPFGE